MRRILTTRKTRWSLLTETMGAVWDMHACSKKVFDHGKVSEILAADSENAASQGDGAT